MTADQKSTLQGVLSAVTVLVGLCTNLLSSLPVGAGWRATIIAALVAMYGLITNRSNRTVSATIGTTALAFVLLALPNLACADSTTVVMSAIPTATTTTAATLIVPSSLDNQLLTMASTKNGGRLGFGCDLVSMAPFARARAVSFNAVALCPARALTPAKVLVVANTNSPASVQLATYYMQARAIPSANRLLVSWTASDTAASCTSAQAVVLSAAIRAKATEIGADAIVLCRNLPYLVTGVGSLDSLIASNGKGSRTNPYYMKSDPFARSTYGMYLVTRLDGWSWDDARALVDRSVAARPSGAVLLDKDPAQTGGYIRWNAQLDGAATTLTQLGVPYTLDATTTFVGGTGLAGYASWGSNDKRYVASTYKAITFAPGAIACTAVSTSAASLRTEPSSGQSQIAQLVRNGVTGVSGYITEPGLSGVTNPAYLFARYAAGMSLGEAFYAAAPCVGMKEVVIGDPLCRPYGK